VPTTGKFYIYCFSDGAEIAYVGKGSGRRIKQQEKRFGYPGRILEYLANERDAYEREVYWIKVLRPSENKNAGGAGKTSDPNPIPVSLRGLVSDAEWELAEKQVAKEFKEVDRVGVRRYAARFIMTRINERNAGVYGMSKVDLDRISEVANGPRY